MRAIDFLKEAIYINAEIEKKEETKQEVKAMAFRTNAPEISERVQTSVNPQKMADAVIRYVEIEEEMNAEIDRLVNKKIEILQVIEKLKAKEYDVIYKRYIRGMSYKDIARYTGKSVNSIKATHRRAMVNVQKLLDGGVKNDR